MNKLPYLCLIGLLGGVGGVSNPVGAVDRDQIRALTQMSLEDLVDVSITTASRREERVMDTPASVVVITAQQIRERGYVNLVDLLQDLPGVDVQRNSKSSLYHNITLHGHLSNDKFLILQDGTRIDSPTGVAIPVAENFPLYNARQVEILYGPAAALYGSDAFGGVINIITVRPGDLDGGRFVTALGSDDYRYYQVQAGKQLTENFGLSVGGHVHAADTGDLAKAYPAAFPRVNATTFGGEVVVPAAEREAYTGPVSSKAAYAKLNYTDDLTLGYNYSFFRSLTSTGDRPDTALYLDEGQWNTEISTAYGKYRFDLGAEVQGELKLNYAHYEVRPSTRYINIYVNFSDHGYQYAETSRYGLEQQFNWQINQRHNLIAGLAYDHYDALPEVADLPRPYNPGLSPSQQGFFYDNTDLPIRTFELSYHNLALYAQLQSAWNPQFATTLGLRYDKNSRYGDTANPRLGLVYKPSARRAFKLLYGEAFRAPSTAESYATFGAFTGDKNADGLYLGSGFRVPSPDLQPEQGQTLEAEFSGLLRPDLTFSLGAYYSQSDNLIFTVNQTESTQFIPGALLSNTTAKVNAGNSDHYGVDASLNYQHRFSPALNADLWTSYSYVKGRVQQDLNAGKLDLPYIAEHKFKLGATLRYRERYFVSPKLYLISPTNSGRADRAHPGERLQAPGYVLVNLRLGVEQLWQENLSLYLDANNLFDTRYYAAGGSGGGTFVSMPQQPRSLALWLKYQF